MFQKLWIMYTRWKANRKEEQFERGYEWALTELRCGNTIEEIEGQLDPEFMQDAFDVGALQALLDCSNGRIEVGM